MILSIITINYNDAEGLRKTIKSVASQSCRRLLEHIIVEGGSTDGSMDVVEDNKDRIDQIVLLPGSGIYEAMNEGTRNATGEYCLFLNSGDNFHDDHSIERVIGELKDFDFVIGKMIFLNSGQTMSVSAPITLKSLYLNSIPHNAAFIKRSLLEKYPYDEMLRIVSDWKFFVQALILDNASYKLVDSIVSDFDCNGISSRNRDLCQVERVKVFKELFPERVMLDYFQYFNGAGYIDSDYDRFFVKLRDYKYGKVLYTLDVLIMKFIALFKKGARFVRSFPIRYEKS